eukprot:TRINITY_DN2078_c0_g1_i8.p1 TRINITY_DN2078_c0_g1~~TRINITY_DN2078_c0_g1_i8.p1  ORF type:complete len:296 (-),score=6.78 TRINITY_DN2078_c0_g1_i8:999-1886(-)
MDASNLVQLLQHEFHSAGIDICNGFSVAEYNKLVKFQLPTFSRRDPLGVVIGSTKVFWPHFIQWLSSLPSIPKDPIDNFYRHTVERVIKALDIPGLQYEIRYDWDRPATGRFVHVQTAGHLAGVAFYDQECMWSCHPEFGLWFVYRAAVVFSVEIDGFVPSVPRQVLTPEIVTVCTKLTLQHLLRRLMARHTGHQIVVRRCGGREMAKFLHSLENKGLLSDWKRAVPIRWGHVGLLLPNPRARLISSGAYSPSYRDTKERLILRDRRYAVIDKSTLWAVASSVQVPCRLCRPRSY